MAIFNYNYTLNTSECSSKFHKAELPFLLILSLISNLVATINLLSMLKSMKSRNLWLLVILAANDIFSSGTLLTSIIANTLTCAQFTLNPLCEILGLFGFMSFGLSLNLVALISFERFLMVLFPIYHHTKLTVGKLLILVVISIVINTILVALPLVNVGAPYIFYEDNQFCAFDWAAWQQKNASHAKLVLCTAIYMALLEIVIIVFNISIFFALRIRAKTFARNMNSTLINAQQKANKFALLTKVITVVNCVCNLPFSIKVMVDYTSKKDHIEGLEDSITSILLFLTPIINPFLYLIFNKVYRKHLFNPILKAFKRCQSNKVHPESSNSNPSNPSNE